MTNTPLATDVYFVDDVVVDKGGPVGNLELVGALNYKAGTRGLGLVGVCNYLAGTTGLGAPEALSRIP